MPLLLWWLFNLRFSMWLALRLLNLEFPLLLLRLFNLGFSFLNLGLSLLLLSLSLMLLNLRPLFILLLPFSSHFLSLLWWSRSIVLDAPTSSPFPISIITPGPPVLLKSRVRNPFVVPAVSVPIVVPVVSSPTRIYVKIETWNIVIINPAPVIIP
jgi:hypothetical protein